jgi:hypothetical protein
MATDKTEAGMCGKMLRSNRGGPHNKTSTTIRNTSSLFFDKKKKKLTADLQKLKRHKTFVVCL